MMHFINPKRISLICYLLLVTVTYSFCNEVNDKIPEEVKNYVFDYLTKRLESKAPSFSKKEKEECIKYDKLLCINHKWGKTRNVRFITTKRL